QILRVEFMGTPPLFLEYTNAPYTNPRSTAIHPPKSSAENIGLTTKPPKECPSEMKGPRPVRSAATSSSHARKTFAAPNASTPTIKVAIATPTPAMRQLASLLALRVVSAPKQVLTTYPAISAANTPGRYAQNDSSSSADQAIPPANR